MLLISIRSADKMRLAFMISSLMHRKFIFGYIKNRNSPPWYRTMIFSCLVGCEIDNSLLLLIISPYWTPWLLLIYFNNSSKDNLTANMISNISSLSKNIDIYAADIMECVTISYASPGTRLSVISRYQGAPDRLVPGAAYVTTSTDCTGNTVYWS